MITAEYAKSLLQSTTTWLVLFALLFLLFSVLRFRKRRGKTRYPTFDEFVRKRRRQAALRKLRHHIRPISWFRKFYVWIIVGLSAGLLAYAAQHYLREIAHSVTGMVDLLGALVSDAQNEDPSQGTRDYANLRNVGYATAALLGVLAASATLFFSLIRVWTNERTTRATEEGLITDRINKAVEGLGTDKTVKQPRVDSDGAQIHILDDSGEPDLTRPVYDEKTEPNIEVRVGAILSLERIAEDSERDHISIMEVLCAYIRQNAAGPDMPMPPDLQGPITERWQLHLGWEAWQAWAAQFRSAPRLDLDVAHRVISKRPQRRIRYEEVLDRRLNLQNVDLSGLVLQDSDLTRADLRNAKLQGAVLTGAELQGADLGSARLQGAVLRDAKLQGADLKDAELQGADLWGAELQGANLEGAKLQGANLEGAELQGANLIRAELQGANLWGAEFDAATKLSSATLRSALLRSVDFTSVPQIDAHLDPAQVFFDGSITLPGGITSDMPEWPYEDRRGVYDDDGALFIAWRAWQREHHPDTLPDHLR